MAQKNPWEWYQPPSMINEDVPYNEMETPESIQALYGGYQPPTTPTGQPSIAQTEPIKPAWTEIPPPGMGYNLARGLGAAAAAIAPRSIGGRLGAAAMGLAGQEEANRLQRIRMGSTIQETQSRTGLAQQLFDMRKQEQERKIASGQQGASWMRSSGFTKELDQVIGIPGSGEMMALAVQNGLFPVHELFSLKKGKDIPVPIEAWSYFGMETPPDELAKTVGWKTFLEMYKAQQGKQYASREVTAWNPELKQWGFMDRNTNDWLKDKSGKPLKAPPPASTVPGFTYFQGQTGEYQQAPTKGGGVPKPTGVMAPPKDTQSRQMGIARNIFVEREGREPTEQEAKDEWNKQFPQKQTAADRLKSLFGTGQGQKAEQEYDLINGKLVPRKK